MNIPKIYRHEYVCCLPKELEIAIMEEVKAEIATLLITDKEKAEAIENANYSKACDLTDTIEIEFF